MAKEVRAALPRGILLLGFHVQRVYGNLQHRQPLRQPYAPSSIVLCIRGSDGFLPAARRWIAALRKRRGVQKHTELLLLQRTQEPTLKEKKFKH